MLLTHFSFQISITTYNFNLLSHQQASKMYFIQFSTYNYLKRVIFRFWRDNMHFFQYIARHLNYKIKRSIQCKLKHFCTYFNDKYTCIWNFLQKFKQFHKCFRFFGSGTKKVGNFCHFYGILGNFQVPKRKLMILFHPNTKRILKN